MKTLRYFFVAALAMVMGNAMAEELVDFTAKGYANAQEITVVEGTANVTLTFAANGGTTPKYYTTGTAIRMYAKNSLTIESAKTIKAIKFVLAGDGLINETNKSFDVGEYSFEDTKWTGSANKVVMTNAASSGNQIRIQKLTIYFDGDVIPSDVHIANTPETAYTVAKAFELIDAGQALSETVYVKGTVSKVDKFNDDKTITYWISDDGTTTKQLEAYKGKGVNGAEFASIDDVAVGATVIVKGTLTKYTPSSGDPIYEFNANNEMYSYTTGISTVKANSKFEGKMYNMAGQVVDKSYKGLVIMNGKKFMNK